jgi:hypothetical protein
MKYFIAVILIITLGLSAIITRAPNIKDVPLNQSPASGVLPIPPSPTSLDELIIYQVPDLRATAGSPGKNIAFAEDGQNVAVIYNRYSGDPTNIMQVYVAYSTDRGANWIHYGPLSTFNARRTYPGLDAEENWPDAIDLRVHFAWHQAQQISGSYDSSPTFYAKEVMYPDGLITAANRLTNSGTWDVWGCAVAVKDSIIVYTAANNGTFLTTYDCYIWRSTDYGETWDDGRVFFPGPLEWMWGPHMRFGSDGYIFFLWNRQLESNPDQYWPYFCESFDYGVTWSQPQLLWQNTPPYPDMSTIRSWWYKYDCEVVRDTPAVIIQFSSGNLDYGEIWAYYPVSGGPGSWQFQGEKLVGGDSTSPQTYARSPTVAADDNGNIFAGYQAVFETPIDTGYDCGLFVRRAGQNTWIDWGMITENFDDIEEKNMEFAHNAPRDGDNSIVGMIFHNAADYPTTGNLYFHYVSLNPDGIAEPEHTNFNNSKITIAPNPAINNFAVKYLLPKAGPVSLQIYDITGTLVKSYNNSNLSQNGLVLIDTKILSSGVYILRFISEETNITRKVVIEK